MKPVKKLLVGIGFVGSLVVSPLAIGVVAHAQVALDVPFLLCRFDNDGIFYDSEGCDLAVNKEVSINDGAYQAADTEATAAQATVGDKVTWKITVSNPNAEEAFAQPFGLVRVIDVLPTSGVSYDGSSYTASIGSYSSNVWEFPLFETTDPAHTNLPATLTIVTHSTANGLFENTAALSAYNSCRSENSCFWPEVGGYQDANPANDTNDAWIDPSAKPVVLAETTELANTGSGTLASLIAGGLIVATLGALGLSRRSN